MLNFAKVLLSVLFLCTLFVSPAQAICPVGDLNQDCTVDFHDLKIFAAQWLDPSCSGPDCADFDGFMGVNMDDFAALAQNWTETVTSLTINEFMASNNAAYADPYGDYNDWVEIYNADTVAIDIGGMYLTDDLAVPNKWQIPTNNPSATTIAPNGYLVIWADDTPSKGTLHATFKLSASGEDIGLFQFDGISLIDSISFGDQVTDISYGRYPDASSILRFFATPTPLQPNSGAYVDVVADTQFSHDQGFYTSSFNLGINCNTTDAEIRCTIDGSEPTETSSLYSTPILINSTTCLRAKAFKAGWMPTNIDTQTYLFLDDVITQSGTPGQGWPTGSVNGQEIDYGMDPDVVYDGDYIGLVDDALLAIPTISLVTDLDNLFDSSTGIYVNAEQHGDVWERPTSVELINPDDSEGFQVNAGLRIRGGWSRHPDNPKHAFRLFFRSDYGDAELDYPMFGNEGVDKFEKMDLRTAQNYSWSYNGDSQNTMLREVFSRDTQGQMGQPYTRSRYYHLYINGQYWGIYQSEERPEARYAASYFGGNAEDYDVVKPIGWPDEPTYTIEATDGTLDAYEDLWDAATAGFADNSAYYQVQGLDPDGTRNPAYNVQLDVDNLIDYMLNTFYVGDFDSPITIWFSGVNNFYALYNRNGQDGWKFFRHDAEHSLFAHVGGDWFWRSIDVTGPYNFTSAFSMFNPQWLHERLTANAEYRMRFADRTYKHFFNDGPLVASTAVATITARKNQIDSAIIAESARWGDSKTSTPKTRNDDWLPTVNTLISNFFPTRIGVVIGQLRNDSWYPNTNPPTYNQHGGYVSSGFNLTMTNPNGSGTIYYTLDGSDPRISGDSASGTTTTLVSENASKRVTVPTGSISSWNTPGFNDSSWTLGTGGVGYERNPGDPVNYASLINIDVESGMYNTNSTSYIRIPFNVDAGDLPSYTSMSLNIRYDDGFIAYINGVKVAEHLAPGTPAWNSNSTNQRSDSECVNLAAFNISGHIGDLQAGSNMLAIQGLNVSNTSSDFLISAELEVSAGGGSPGDVSPTASAYTGPVTLTTSTQVKARVLDSSEWSALNETVFAIGPVAEKLRITEIMYHPQDTGNPNDPNEEFIELQNIGTTALNLNLVSLTNGVYFTFPDMSLAAGDYVLVVKDINAFEAQYGTGMNIAGEYSASLSNGGEEIDLDDAIGTEILDFDYKDGWRDITDGEGFSLTIINPSNPDVNSWDVKASWRASAYKDGSPDAGDDGIIPNPGDIVINEVLAHSDTIPHDWIELHNTTGSSIDIGGWYLSDNDSNETTLKKSQIAPGTSISGNGYIVFYQNTHFSEFALSENGEKVCLSSAEDGVLTGFRKKEDFGASQADIAFGRYQKSDDSFNFVAMSSNTAGSANAEPKVGPIVINEIMYNPDSGNQNEEYIELHNISDSAVTLYDYSTSEPWKFTDGIDFTFPDDPPVTIPAGGYLMVVKNPTAFTSKYGSMPGGVDVLGPYEGYLSNGGEKVEISMPGDVDNQAVRQYIRVDRVNYNDKTPWPTEPDGNGNYSLTRKVSSDYGNDVINWQADTPSPGTINP